ncbi:MAG: VWA domain-containing protein [Candidatus Nanohaloarchaea archaeon]
MTGLKRKIGFLNIFTALILVLAAAGPQMSVTQEENLRPSITVIEDTSESSNLIEDWRSSADSSNLDVRTVNSDSDSFEAQVRSITEENQDYLFVSDLQFDSGLPQYFSDNNISMNLLTPEMVEEHSIEISGPSQTVIGAENQFEVEVDSSTEESPEVEVFLNNETVKSGQPPLELNMSFEEEGVEKLSARIESEDEYQSNNEYFKAVKVNERPEIASIGERSGLEEDFSDFYEIDSSDGIPENLDSYQALILKESADSQELRDYMVDGGGVMYTGSDYSSDYLPVAPAEKEDKTDAPMIIFAIDISVGTEESGASESAKQIAYQLVEGLPDNSRVGVVAYNRYSYDVVEPTLLASDREGVQSKISQLQPEGPTFHNYGLRASESMISRNQGEGNIVMITDGKISTLAERSDVKREAEIEANTLSGRLITIGVGDNFPAEIDEEDKDFLKNLAERTEGGFYLDGNSAGELGLTFDAGGGADQMQPLVVSNSNHFITEGYSPNATVFEVDGSRPRTAASQLVSTSSGEPVLTTTRYGLGRIAAFTADNPNVETLMKEDPALVGRTMSWVSGPLEEDLWVEGSRRGDEFTMVSRERVSGFSRESNERYVRELNPEETGFHETENLTYSVNYRPEIEEVGYNEEEFSSFTNNGNVYDSENIDVLFERMEMETSENTENLDLTPYLVGLAVLLYLGFVGLRKRNGLA